MFRIMFMYDDYYLDMFRFRVNRISWYYVDHDLWDFAICFIFFQAVWVGMDCQKKKNGPTTWRWSSGVPMQAHQALRATCLLEKNDPSKFEGLEFRHQQLPASLSITKHHFVSPCCILSLFIPEGAPDGAHSNAGDSLISANIRLKTQGWNGRWPLVAASLRAWFHL